MKKFTLIAGPCAMEEFDTAFEIANHVKAICSELDIHYIFKASYKKANRSKLDSFRGIGDVEALEMIKKIGKTADPYKHKISEESLRKYFLAISRY